MLTGVARLIEALDGLDRYEARDWIVQTATEEGWLDGIDADRHMVPHGDRSKVAIEPYLTDQWFVDTAKIVGPAIDAVRDGTVQILPEGDKKVYFHWLENIEPWCISRQLWWGHQIPVWYGPIEARSATAMASRRTILVTASNRLGCWRRTRWRAAKDFAATQCDRGLRTIRLKPTTMPANFVDLETATMRFSTA